LRVREPWRAPRLTVKACRNTHHMPLRAARQGGASPVAVARDVHAKNRVERELAPKN